MARLASAASYWAQLPPALLDRLPTPSLLVYMDVVRHNVSRMLQAVGTADRWRPHLKTTKLAPVWRELLRAGVHSFKCATVREARTLLDLVEREESLTRPVDLLVAHPLSKPNLLALADVVCAHRARGGRSIVSVLIEDELSARRAPESLRLFLDLNPPGPPDAADGAGAYNRTGCELHDTERVHAAVRAAGERLHGLHFYDGHGPVEGNYAAFCELIDRLPLQRPPLLVTSGTPTFEGALSFAGFRGRAHAVSPGTVVFTDGRTLEQTSEELDLRPAALVLARVVSRPAPARATCDAGSKSLAAEVGDPCVHVLGRPDLLALTPSEEHLPLTRAAGAEGGRARAGAVSESKPLLELDEPLLLCPRHICPTVNLAENAVLIETGCKPRIVPVDARAHD